MVCPFCLAKSNQVCVHLGVLHTGEAEAAPQSLTQIYALPEIPRDQNAAESWETLEAVC